MQKVTRLFAVVCFACVLAAWTSAVLAQETAQVPPGQTQETQVQSATGKLKSVDSDAKKVTITSSAGDDMEFTYNEQTMIAGAESTVEGLAGKSGADVTVSYKEDKGVKTATRIEVKATT